MINTPEKFSAPRLIHTLFEAQVQQLPDAIALDFHGQRLTYQELDHQSNQLAQRLSAFNLQSDDLVGICLERSIDLVVGLLAILKVGAAYLPLDPSYPLERLSTIVSDATPKLLLTTAGACDLLATLVPTLDLAAERENISQLSREAIATEVQPHHLAYVIYTSGSTGKAKGVAIEHRNTVAFLDWVLDYFTAEQLSGVLASTSICFDLSVFEIFGTLAAGGTIILTENALTVGQLPLETRQAITLINTVPSAAAALLKTQSIPTSVSVMNLAGEPLPNKVAQQLYELGHIRQVYNLYGPSEDTTYSTVALVVQGSIEPPSIGKPLSNTEIFLFDSNLHPVSGDEVGEIYIRSFKLARGYLNQPQLTAERFVHHPILGRLYKTGDLGQWLPDGNLKYLGRIDHQVKIRGFRVEMGEIEATISKHSGVESCVVVDRSTPHGSQLAAYIVPTTDSFGHSIENWKSVWDGTYTQSFSTAFNTVGWNNRVTGLPFTKNEMIDWVENTVDQVLSIQPRRVLEIGCGTGLLLLKLAPLCEHYIGVDVSSEAIRHIQLQLTGDEALENKVDLHCLAAHEIEKLTTQVDVVIINSVIQYFPSEAYLAKVIKDAIALLSPGGCVFIGDVRDAALLETLHVERALYHSPGDRSINRVHQLVSQQVQQEHELLVNPAYFYSLAHQKSSIGVDVQLKRGRHHNELTQYRFDVFLFANLKTSLETVKPEFDLDWQTQKWQDQSTAITALTNLLSTQRPQYGRITNIPNPRLQSQLAATHLLKQVSCITVAEFRNQVAQPDSGGIDPFLFESLEGQLPYRVSFHPTTQLGCYEVRFIRDGLKTAAVHFSASHLSNPEVHEPSPDLTHKRLIKEVRELLQRTLPHYMVPQHICCLEALPLTLNGKINRKALPEVGRDRPLDLLYVAPQTELEIQVCQIWSELLDCEIGVDDSFFHLGGHSLLAVQLLSQVELQTGVSISLFEFLRCPTVREMTRLISSDNSTLSDATSLQADAILHPSIVTQPRRCSTAQAGILLTGVTGFLGSFLLDTLLRETSETIYCLVRAANVDEGFNRLKHTFDQFSLNTSELKHRVVIVPGDLTYPQLRLTSLEQLADCIHTIFHSAAEVNLMRPYEQLRSANVVGTQEVLRLAAVNSIPVHFISTIDILHALSDRPVNELSSSPVVDQVYGGYAQTKWVGESLMTAARDRHIQTTIHRAGMLTGHSATGVGPTEDLMARLILGIVHLKTAPLLDYSLNLIPIDFACQQIIRPSKAPLRHIVYPVSLHWQSLIQELNQFGFSIELVPHAMWQSQVRETCTDATHPLTAIRPLLTDSFYESKSYLEMFLQVSNAAVSAFPVSTTVTTPSELIRRYLIYFTKLKLLPEVRSKVFSR